MAIRFENHPETTRRVADAIQAVFADPLRWHMNLHFAAADGAINEYVACLAVQVERDAAAWLDDYARQSIAVAFAQQAGDNEYSTLATGELEQLTETRDAARRYLEAMLALSLDLNQRTLQLLSAAEDLVDWWDHEDGPTRDASALILRLRDAMLAMPNLKYSGERPIDRTQYDAAVNLLITRAMRAALRRIPESEVDRAREALDDLLDGALTRKTGESPTDDQ